MSSNLQSLSTTPPSRLRPYLTTPQLISLAAFASPLISLLFILFRLSASSDVAQQSVADAKGSFQASCLAAERAASVGASLPRYLAIGTNEKLTESVRATIEGVRIVLTLSLTATEAIIEFVIDMYRSTFLCFLELVIRGGLAIIIEAVASITSFINNTLSSVTSGIANDVQAANNVIQTAVDVVKKIPFVGDNINIPQFSIPSAAQLANIQIPTTFEDQLKNLNGSIPTLEDLREKLDSLISIPFQLLKKEINDTFIEAQSSFVASPFSIPQQATITFCGDTVSGTFDSLAADLIRIARIGIIIVITSMVLTLLFYGFVTWYSQRSLRNTIERIRALWFGDGTATTDRLLAFDALIAHPLWSRVVQWLTEKFRLGQERYDALTWFGLYVFHPAPMACLLIGIFGILSIQIQLLVVSPLQHQYSNEISNNINDLTGKIATKLNDTMWQESVVYAQSFNQKIDGVQNTINNDLFGWVNATIVPLNNTLAGFYSDVQNAVDSLFGNTPFDAPAQEFVKCILGSKILGLEKALTFLQENLQVDLPRVDEGALVLSSSSVNEVAQPISAAAVGSGDNGSDGGLVGQVITRYINALKKERITFFIFLLLWAAVVVAALLIIAWNFWFAPAFWRRGYRRPLWLFGNEWIAPPPDVKPFDAEKARSEDHKTSFVPTLTPPHRKDDESGSSSATIFGAFHDRLRFRGLTPTRTTTDVEPSTSMRSRLPKLPDLPKLPKLPELRPPKLPKLPKPPKLPKLSLNHGPTYSDKKKSDPKLLPTNDSGEDADLFGWTRNLNFRKRGSEASDLQKLIEKDEPRSWFNEPSGSSPVRPPRTKPGLRVDTVKASNVPSIQPRVILELPDNPFEAYVPAATTSTSAPNAPVSRKASTDTESRSRPKRRDSPPQDTPHLTVPSSRAMRNPTPPDWVVAMQSKRTGTETTSGRRPSDGAVRPRPPGLGAPLKASLQRGDSTESGGSRRDRDERRQKRRSSVPPMMEMSTPNGQQQPRAPNQNQNQRSQRTRSRRSSFDSADPFATPMMKVNKPLPLMELPAPLQPLNLQTTGIARVAPAAAAGSSHPALIVIPPELGNPFPRAINRAQHQNAEETIILRNPFATPFDDSNATAGVSNPSVSKPGAGAPGANHAYNFSMPTRPRDISP